MNNEKEKHAGGRPPMFNDCEELENKINDYFENGVRKRKRIIGKGDKAHEVEIEVPTITGLCYHCGFASRQSFYDYEKTDEFSYIVKRARLLIEMEYEEMLSQGNTTGAIFALKNMGWKDKQEVENTVKIDPFETLTDEELDAELEKD